MDKNTIINQTVVHASHILQMKVEYLELLASIFMERGEVQKAKRVNKDIRRMKAAIATMDKHHGCWA